MPETTNVYGQKYAQHYYCRLPRRFVPLRRLTALKSLLLEQFWIPYASRQLLETVAVVKPDQLWLNLYGWAIGPIWRSGIVRKVRAHATVWDFPDTAEYQRRWGKERCERVLRWALSVYGLATSCDAISVPMRDELARQTGRQDASIIHSGLEEHDVAQLKVSAASPDRKIRIAYAGNIVVPEAFQFFVSALRQAAQKLNRLISIEFFGNTSHANSAWFDSSWMREHGVLKESALIDQLRLCAWGLVAMDIEDNDPRYNRFSFPNKFGTYLSAGLPILLISGSESSVAKMLLEHPVGVRLESNRLLGHLLEILRLEDPRADFRTPIQYCAETEFYMPRIRKTLWEKLGVLSSQ